MAIVGFSEPVSLTTANGAHFVCFCQIQVMINFLYGVIW